MSLLHLNNLNNKLVSWISGVLTTAELVFDFVNSRIGIGVTPSGSLDIEQTFNVDQAFAFRAIAQHNTATGGTVYGAQFTVRAGHSSGTMNNATAFIIQAQYNGTSASSPAMNAATGTQSRFAVFGASPVGTITTVQAFQIDTVANFGTGTPNVTITQNRGLIIGNLGSGNGVNGLTVSNSSAIAIAGSQTAAGNSAVLNISNTGSVPFTPTGTWCIFNASTRPNHIAGPILVGTTTIPTGSNFIAFADGTAPAAASNIASVYADDVGGTTNLFGINEAGEITRLTWPAPQTYTETNVTTDRAFDADTVTLPELADVVGTLIADLRARGIVA